MTLPCAPCKAADIFHTDGFKGTLNFTQQINRMTPSESTSPCITPQAQLFNFKAKRPFTGLSPSCQQNPGLPLTCWLPGIDKFIFQAFPIQKLKTQHLTDQACVLHKTLEFRWLLARKCSS